MPYLLAIVIVAIAVVLGIFTGVWGGLVWLIAVGVVLALILAFHARGRTIRSADVPPTGGPRSGPAASGTANERVGQR